MGRKRLKNRQLPERMYKRGPSYYFVDYQGKWHYLGRDYAKAMSAYGLLTGPKGNLSKFPQLLDRYMAEIAPTKAAATFRSDTQAAKFLRVAFAGFDADEVTQKAIYRYMDGRTSKVRANRELALMSMVYQYGIKWGAVTMNPCKGIMRHREKPRDRMILDWEYTAFKEYAGPFIAAYMDVKLLTALRQGDLLAMTLDQLKEDGIHLTVSKTKKRQIIEWSDELCLAINNAKALHPRLKVQQLNRPLFATRKGTRYTSDGFRSIWHRKMTKAVAEGVLTTRFTEHDLRGKAASETTLEHAQRLLSHQSSKTTERHYRRKAQRVKPLR